jgi:hypothetical protein
MDAIKDVGYSGTNAQTVFLRTSVVLLALTTAGIHASLGGILFTINAVGYTALAVAMILPGRIGGIRWLIRLALIGFTAATIAGWVLFGARFPLAYLDKGVEVVLIVFLTLEVWLLDGGPFGVARRMRRLLDSVAARVLARGER